MANPLKDKELEQYRNLLETPTEFKDGFGWSTIAGIFFCGLVMLPGSIYLGLMTGGNMGAAGTWVTVILFAQIARRALKTMSKQELVVLLHAAGFMVAANAMFPGGPFSHLVYRAYLVTSDAARDAGMMNSFPNWIVPDPDSVAITERNLLHREWLIPILLMFFMSFIGFVRRYTLGYFFFRLTSDIENLPFPLAPISAQGAMAMAEMDEPAAKTDAAADGSGTAQAAKGDDLDAGRLATGKSFKRKGSARWRLFSLGVTIGLAFGLLQVGVPAITGLIFESPLYLIPLPFIETTVLTEGLLPATPTGIALDLGVILLGMVLPFWAVMGTFFAILLTIVLNPILHHAGVLTNWKPGMDTVNTTFANSMDFWMSFGIGAGLGIAAVSIYSSVRDVRRKVKELKAKRAAQNDDERAAESASVWATPKKGRGDYSLWLALVIYAATSISVIILCHILVPEVHWLFLVFFTFIYNPFISYVNARLLGIAGQNIDIPFIKEAAFILSGAKGVDIWLAPIPIENYGGMAQSFRVNELTGVSFFSLMKADLVALPVLFLLSFAFWGFMWKSGAVPSSAYPYAQVFWELKTKQDVLLYSSTFVPEGSKAEDVSILDSQFMKEAVHPKVIGTGFVSTCVVFAVLSIFGLPVMLIYGFIRGMGQIPHVMVLEIVGALIGRYLLQKKYGTQEFLRMIPVVMAGYFTGVGLVSMATIAMELIKQAVSSAPF